MRKVKELLATRSQPVAAVGTQETVFEAAKKMKDRRIGALVVTDGASVVGIFTERDVLYRIVADGKDPKTTLIETVMTSPVACCTTDTSLVECRNVMRDKKIRHLPVVDENKLAGIVSLRDLVDHEIDEQQETIHYLNEYLYGG